MAKLLRRLAEAHGVEEVAVITTVHDPAVRRRSYSLLADAVASTPAELATTA